MPTSFRLPLQEEEPFFNNKIHLNFTLSAILGLREYALLAVGSMEYAQRGFPMARFRKISILQQFCTNSCYVLVSFSAFYKMSTFSKTPHQLTKEALKSALRANSIPLPRAEQKKAFYVDLYLEHLTSQNDDEEFSSDDEESSEHSPMRASKVLNSSLMYSTPIF